MLPQALQRSDALIFRSRNRKHAGAHRVAVHHYRAGTALPQAAAEARAVQLQVSAQDVQERCVGICFNDSRLAIYFQRDSRHGGFPFWTARQRSTGPLLAIHELYGHPNRFLPKYTPTHTGKEMPSLNMQTHIDSYRNVLLHWEALAGCAKSNLFCQSGGARNPCAVYAHEKRKRDSSLRSE